MQRHRRFIVLIVTFIAGLGILSASPTYGAINLSHRIYLPFVMKAAPLQVQQVHVIRERGGGFHVVGEVVSLSSSPVYSATLEAVYRTPSGCTASNRGTTLFPATLPGASNLFRIGYPQSDCDWLDENMYPNFTVEVGVLTWTQTTSGPQYGAPTIVDTRLEGSSIYGYSVELRNDYTQTLRHVEVLGWVARTGDYMRTPVGTLAPGQQVWVRVIPEDYGWPSDVRALTQGELVP